MKYQLRLSALLIGFSLLHLPARAALCTPPVVEQESAYHYMVSLTEALSYAKSALSRTATTDLGQRPSDFEFLLGLKLGKSDFECAQSQVSPYATSSNEAIKTSAKGAAEVFARLVELNNRSVAEYKAFLDSVGGGKVKPGTVLERQAELGASYDEAWKLLITAVIAGTYAVVEVEPTTGRMSRLALTRVQRDVVLKKLVSTFGDDIKKGLRAGQVPLTAAASVLYQVVGDPQRKLRAPN